MMLASRLARAPPRLAARAALVGRARNRRVARPGRRGDVRRPARAAHRAVGRAAAPAAGMEEPARDALLDACCGAGLVRCAHAGARGRRARRGGGPTWRRARLLGAMLAAARRRRARPRARRGRQRSSGRRRSCRSATTASTRWCARTACSTCPTRVPRGGRARAPARRPARLLDVGRRRTRGSRSRSTRSKRSADRAAPAPAAPAAAEGPAGPRFFADPENAAAAVEAAGLVADSAGAGARVAALAAACAGVAPPSTVGARRCSCGGRGGSAPASSAPSSAAPRARAPKLLAAAGARPRARADARALLRDRELARGQGAGIPTVYDGPQAGAGC